MVWRIEFDAAATKNLRDLDPAVQRQILRYLRQRIATSEDPRRFGKPLRADKRGLWRYRVRDFRILARIEDEVFVVFVVAVGHRREIYG